MPGSPGCSHSQMLHLMHLAAQEHTQLNKTLLMLKAVRGWRDLSKLKVLHMPLSCPSAVQPAQKQCMFWMAPRCRIVLLGGNRSVFRTVFKEDTIDYCWEVLWQGQWASPPQQSLYLEITALRASVLLSSVLHMLPKRAGRQWLQHSAVHQPSG